MNDGLIMVMLIIIMAGVSFWLAALYYSMDRIGDELRKIKNVLEDNKHGDD